MLDKQTSNLIRELSKTTLQTEILIYLHSKGVSIKKGTVSKHSVPKNERHIKLTCRLCGDTFITNTYRKYCENCTGRSRKEYKKSDIEASLEKIAKELKIKKSLLKKLLINNTISEIRKWIKNNKTITEDTKIPFGYYDYLLNK